MKTLGMGIWTGALVVGLSLAGCQPPPPTASPEEVKAHEKAAEAADSIRNAEEKTVEAAKAGAAVAEEKINQGVEKAEKAIGDAKRDLESPSK
jgi:hypothetical protein